MIVKRIVITEASLGAFLQELALPQNLIKKLLMEKRISCDREEVFLEKKLKKGSIISFNLDGFEKNDIVPYQKQLEIIYEDEEIILVKKERGMLIHSDSNTNDTLLNALSYYLGENIKVRCLHRIDVETIGLVLFSKNLISYHYLNKQMEENKIKKVYLAVVEGIIKNDFGKIEAPIGRNRHLNNHYRVSKNGKYALTEYQVLKRYDNKTKVKVSIKTGRTHQIRVHFAYLNHPIVGDEIYGTGGQLLLQSYMLGFKHPSTFKYGEYFCDESLELKL